MYSSNLYASNDSGVKSTVYRKLLTQFNSLVFYLTDFWSFYLPLRIYWFRTISPWSAISMGRFSGGWCSEVSKFSSTQRKIHDKFCGNWILSSCMQTFSFNLVEIHRNWWRVRKPVEVSTWCSNKVKINQCFDRNQRFLNIYTFS